MVEFGISVLILPFEGVTGSCCMMTCYGTSSSIGGVIVADDETIYRERILFVGHLSCKRINFLLDVIGSWLLDVLALYRMKTQLFQPLHSFAP